MLGYLRTARRFFFPRCQSFIYGLGAFGELSSLLTVKTLTGMTTDVYPRENCIAPAIVLIVWTTNTRNRCAREG